MLVDKEGTNRVEGKEAAEFLRKSGLPKETLRTIWIMAAKTNPSYLEKDEFYIALRLIALAQNNMEYSEESIRLNHPIPPTPTFNMKTNQPNPISHQHDNFNNQNSIKYIINNIFLLYIGLGQNIQQIDSQYESNNSFEDDSKWVITEEDEFKYQKLFSNTKDSDDAVSIHKFKLEDCIMFILFSCCLFMYLF